jgi:hypothetical protein
MNPSKTGLAASVCVVAVLAAALVAVVFEATHPLSPFFDDDDEGVEATADAQIVGATGETDQAIEDPLAAVMLALDGIRQQAGERFVKEAVTEGLMRIGEGVQRLRKPARDATQLLKWALRIGRKYSQVAAG